MQSDDYHRAGKSVIVTGTCRHNRTRKKISMKNWVPKLDDQGDLSEYRNVLDASLREKLPRAFEDMDTLLRDASEVSGAPIKRSRVDKLWKSEALQSLLA